MYIEGPRFAIAFTYTKKKEKKKEETDNKNSKNGTRYYNYIIVHFRANCSPQSGTIFLVLRRRLISIRAR